MGSIAFSDDSLNGEREDDEFEELFENTVSDPYTKK